MTRKAILILVLLGAALLTRVATARTAAVPQNTSPPTISGTAREGNSLTARNGSWANSPTSFVSSTSPPCHRMKRKGSKRYVPFALARSK